MDKPSSLSFLRKKEKSKGRLSVNHVSRRQSFDPEELEKIRALTASDTAVEAQSNDSDLEHAEEFDPINPEGITLLHMPEDPQTHKVDIIFIHGLGGGSYRTWSYKTKPDKFWPKLWLPREVPEARIFTFGYDANVNVLRKGDDVSILDFAKTFLQRVKHYQEGTTQRFGQVPIIVVAHSMGGLVFKQAFVLGHMDPAFHDIIPMFRAVLFLATPHRGSDLAKVLSLFLSSGRTYVEELIRKSTTTDQLRESFRHLAPKLRIISFYETKPTPIALGISTMIVEKDNAILDYPGEESMMLAADHHQVCKFKSTNDNNYRIVIEKIRSVVMQLSSVPAQADTANVPHGDLQQNLDAELEEIAYMLGVEHHIGTPKADPDLLCRISERTDGTCINFLHDTRVENWLNTGKTEILWAYAPAGSGKSMTCAFFTDYLFQNYQHCSFFFFKYGQRARQSPQDMLLSLAYQTARQLPEYRRALLNLAKSGSSRARTLASLDWMAIRRQLFTGFLAPLKTAADLYWVVDGVDEGLSRDQIMRALTEVAADFKGPVKVHILVSSRPLEDIRQVIRVAKAREDKKKDGIIIDEMPFPDNRDDIRRTVDNELDYLPCDEEEHPTLKRDIVERIVDRADGNFLWARLISEKIVQECADYADIEHVLDTTPSGMSEFYDRMMGAIQKLNNNKDKTMAQVILVWAMYSTSPLSFEELVEAYPDVFADPRCNTTGILNLRHIIAKFCGQFVIVDHQRRISLVHHSAREYLETINLGPFNLTPSCAYEQLLSKCLESLCDLSPKGKKTTGKFFLHAARSWPKYLCGSLSGAVSLNQTLAHLVQFFGDADRSPQFPLNWIRCLAKIGHLSDLFDASKALKSYIEWDKLQDSDNELRAVVHSVLASWAMDLSELPTRFHHQLSEHPDLIYTCIPSLCPSSSIINMKFSKAAATALTVKICGPFNRHWDNCVTRLWHGKHDTIKGFTCSESYLAIAYLRDSRDPDGEYISPSMRPSLSAAVIIRDTGIFEQQKALEFTLDLEPDNEGWHIAFNQAGSLLACLSRSRLYVWQVADWSLMMTAPAPDDWYIYQIHDFTFDLNDNLLIAMTEASPFSREGFIFQLDLKGKVHGKTPAWEHLASLPPPRFKETQPDIRNAQFSRDGTQVAFILDDNLLACYQFEPRRMEEYQDVPDIQCWEHRDESSLVAVCLPKILAFAWHPSGTDIVGIREGGRIEKYCLKSGTSMSVQLQDRDIVKTLMTDRIKVRISPDGNSFIVVCTAGDKSSRVTTTTAINIFDFSSLSHLQKLEPKTDGGFEVCLANTWSQGIRIYDCGQESCTIWEPQCFKRLHWQNEMSDRSEQSMQQTCIVFRLPEETWRYGKRFVDAGRLLEHMPATLPPKAPPLEPQWSPAGFLVTRTRDMRSITLWDPDNDQSNQGLEHPVPGLSFNYVEENKVAWPIPFYVIAHSQSIQDKDGNHLYALYVDRTRHEAALQIVSLPKPGTDLPEPMECQSLTTSETLLETPITWRDTRQFLVSPDGKRLLVHRDCTTMLLSLPKGMVVAERKVEDDEAHESMLTPLGVLNSRPYYRWDCWKQHPSRPECLLRFSPASISVILWDNFETITSIPLDLSYITARILVSYTTDPQPPNIKYHIDLSTGNYCSDFVLAKIKPWISRVQVADLQLIKDGRYRPRYLPARTSYEVIIPLQPDLNIIRPILVSREFQTCVYDGPLGILPDRRLVFMDRNFWVCTVTLMPLQFCPELELRDCQVKRHFFIPGNWLDKRSIRWMRLLRDGRLLIPIGGTHRSYYVLPHGGKADYAVILDGIR